MSSNEDGADGVEDCRASLHDAGELVSACVTLAVGAMERYASEAVMDSSGAVILLLLRVDVVFGELGLDAGI